MSGHDSLCVCFDCIAYRASLPLPHQGVGVAIGRQRGMSTQALTVTLDAMRASAPSAAHKGPMGDGEPPVPDIVPDEGASVSSPLSENATVTEWDQVKYLLGLDFLHGAKDVLEEIRSLAEANLGLRRELDEHRTKAEARRISGEASPPDEHEPIVAFKRFIAGWGAHNGERVIARQIIRALESHPYWQPGEVERRRSEAARPEPLPTEAKEAMAEFREWQKSRSAEAPLAVGDEITIPGTVADVFGDGTVRVRFAALGSNRFSMLVDATALSRERANPVIEQIKATPQAELDALTDLDEASASNACANPSTCKEETVFRSVGDGVEARFCVTCEQRFETRATPGSGDPSKVRGTREEWVAAAQREQVQRIEADAEAVRLKNALGEIAALGDVCEDCEVSGAPMATHVTAHPLSGIPIFLCAEHAEATRETNRKMLSKGCGERPAVEEHEQDTAVTLALAALFTRKTTGDAP